MIADLNVVYEGVGSGKDCEGNNRGREHCSQDKGYKLKGRRAAAHCRRKESERPRSACMRHFIANSYQASDGLTALMAVFVGETRRCSCELTGGGICASIA